MSDPFDAPAGEAAAGGDDFIKAQARKSLYRDGAVAVGLALFSVLCCNPFFILTFISAGAGFQVIRQVKWMRISLEEDFPEDAGTAATILGALAVVFSLGGCSLSIAGRTLQLGAATMQ